MLLRAALWWHLFRIHLPDVVWIHQDGAFRGSRLWNQSLRQHSIHIKVLQIRRSNTTFGVIFRDLHNRRDLQDRFRNRPCSEATHIQEMVLYRLCWTYHRKMYLQFGPLLQISCLTRNTQQCLAANSQFSPNRAKLLQCHKYRTSFPCDNWSKTWVFESRYWHLPWSWLSRQHLCSEYIEHRRGMLSSVLLITKAVDLCVQWPHLKLGPHLYHLSQKYRLYLPFQNQIALLAVILFPRYLQLGVLFCL